MRNLFYVLSLVSLVQVIKGQPPLTPLSFSVDSCSEFSPIKYNNGILYCRSCPRNNDKKKEYRWLYADELHGISSSKPIEVSCFHNSTNLMLNHYCEQTQELYFSMDIDASKHKEKIRNYGFVTMRNHGLFKGKIKNLELVDIEPLSINTKQKNIGEATSYILGESTITKDGKRMIASYIERTIISGGEVLEKFEFREYFRLNFNSDWTFLCKIEELSKGERKYNPKFINDSTLILSIKESTISRNRDFFISTLDTSGIWGKPQKAHRLSTKFDDRDYIEIDTNGGYLTSGKDEKYKIYFTHFYDANQVSNTYIHKKHLYEDAKEDNIAVHELGRDSTFINHQIKECSLWLETTGLAAFFSIKNFSTKKTNKISISLTSKMQDDAILISNWKRIQAQYFLINNSFLLEDMFEIFSFLLDIDLKTLIINLEGKNRDLFLVEIQWINGLSISEFIATNMGNNATIDLSIAIKPTGANYQKQDFEKNIDTVSGLRKKIVNALDEYYDHQANSARFWAPIVHNVDTFDTNYNKIIYEVRNVQNEILSDDCGVLFCFWETHQYTIKIAQDNNNILLSISLNGKYSDGIITPGRKFKLIASHYADAENKYLQGIIKKHIYSKF